ncbi:hypothetical protein [Spirosoma validum]|uniref:Uncharacterized protein n=1 Tax=Spirosoma validum TaxID=2771355 RepID=A0A927B7U3_9BACT|nr:hypothetical protein [Spirosoma validum]MBD2757310.1 hypothetical protein [Spirosoma validum]
MIQRKTIRFLFVVWTAVATLPLIAQPLRYKLTQAADNMQVISRESRPGSNSFDQVVSKLPSDAVQGRSAGRSLLPYAPEPKGQINMTQFGTGKYYSPNFHFCIDILGNKSVTERKAVGINSFTPWSVKPEHESQLVYGDEMYYATENFLGNLRNGRFYLNTLQEFFNEAWNVVPTLGYGGLANAKYLVYDIETSLWLNAGNKEENPLPGWRDAGFFSKQDAGDGNWHNVKKKLIKLEISGETMTIEQLAARGQNAWQDEMLVRRANRLTLLMELARYRSKPGSKIAFGASMTQGEPRLDFERANNLFFEGICVVSHIGGDSQGNLTFKKPGGGTVTFRFNGGFYDHEDFNQGYWYRTYFDIDEQDNNDIFVKKKPGTQTYPYLWSKIKPIHIVGEEKGYLQENRRLMRLRNGKVRPIWRQIVAGYENDWHPPFAELQNIRRYGNDKLRDTPRLWQPPYEQYSRYVVTRFFAGDEPDWGFYLFPADPPDVVKDLSSSADPDTKAYYNFSLHPVSALLQARADLQPYETYYTGSTLVEDPEVQVNQTGSFVAYNGVAAVNNDGGKRGPKRPAYMLRYKPVPGGWRVLIMGGMEQNWTDERTDVVRVPGGLLNGNRFKIKLRGPAAQVYEFIVKSSDKDQLYEALPAAAPSWEKPAYAGYVGALPGN